MDTKKQHHRRLYPLAAAIGLALGSMGVAAASTPAAGSPSTKQPAVAPATAPQGATATDQVENGSTPEVETQTDEAVDGIDHQFEGEEVGDNGNGIPDANEQSELDSGEDTTNH